MGAADQLVATAGDHVGPRGDRLGQRRLLLEAELGEIDERAGADVVDDGQVAGPAQADQFLQRHFRGEAHDLVVAGMDPQDRGRTFADRPLVIAEVGLVGRAHLDELCAGGGDDLGQAKGAADFHQLAPGNDHFLAGGHGIEDDRRGGGVVVDHGGGLRAGEQSQEFLDPLVPPGSLAAFHVDLQDRKAGQLPAICRKARAGSTARPKPV